MILNYTDAITQSVKNIESVLNGFVQNTYEFIIHTFRLPLLMAILIYIMVIGYGLTVGWFRLVWRDVMAIFVKISIIVAMLFSWPLFYMVIVRFFTTGVDELTASLGTHALASSTGHGSVFDLSQSLLVEVSRVGLWVWEKASFSSPMPVVMGLLLWICGLGVVLYGCIQILMAKIMITLLLAAAPFMLVFFLYSTFKQITWGWFELLMSNLLAMILVSLAMSFSFYLLHLIFDDLYQTHAQNIKLLHLVPVILLSVLSFTMIKRCVSAAHKMASGFSVVGSSGVAHVMKNMPSAALKLASRWIK